MITPEYCVAMARYNAWQNRQVKAAFERLSEATLTKNRKAFFGSLLGTANHLLWGDLMWMHRLDGGAAPEGGITKSAALCPSAADWAVKRFRADARILLWAEGLKAVDLTGPLTWYSAVKKVEISKSMGLCVMHLFNHQTHHRGQIHAMLTQAGADAPVSDLPFMPDDGPWL
ncbi:DinB family protein [Thalassococcus sp. BH17M4-6]|uniref:DinB family protein n=1 Tax=Thalassococcus sp. BH17M4-6 TaxID=3413148 RepID=UPI003BE6558F